MPGFFSRFLRTTDAVEGACSSDPRKLAPPRPPLVLSLLQHRQFCLEKPTTTDFLLLKLLKSLFLCLQDLFFLQQSVRMFALCALFFFCSVGFTCERRYCIIRCVKSVMCVSRRALQFVATCLSCCQSQIYSMQKLFKSFILLNCTDEMFARSIFVLFVLFQEHCESYFGP